MGRRLKETWALVKLNHLELRKCSKIDVDQTWWVKCYFHHRKKGLTFHLPHWINNDLLGPGHSPRSISFASAQVSLSRLPISRRVSLSLHISLNARVISVREVEQYDRNSSNYRIFSKKACGSYLFSFKTGSIRLRAASIFSIIIPGSLIWYQIRNLSARCH